LRAKRPALVRRMREPLAPLPECGGCVSRTPMKRYKRVFYGLSAPGKTRDGRTCAHRVFSGGADYVRVNRKALAISGYGAAVRRDRARGTLRLSWRQSGALCAREEQTRRLRGASRGCRAQRDCIPAADRPASAIARSRKFGNPYEQSSVRSCSARWRA